MRPHVGLLFASVPEKTLMYNNLISIVLWKLNLTMPVLENKGDSYDLL